VDPQNATFGAVGDEPGSAEGTVVVEPPGRMRCVDFHHVAFSVGIEGDQFVPDNLGQGKGQKTTLEIGGADPAAMGSKQPIAGSESEMFGPVSRDLPSLAGRTL